MKTIKIRKYWSGCSYTHDVLSIPDDAKIYLVNMCNVGYNIDRESNEYTKGYLIIDFKEFEESHKFGDFYIRFEDGILIEDNTLVFDISNAPKPKEVYIYSFPYSDFGLNDIKNELFDEMNSVDPDYNRINELQQQFDEAIKLSKKPIGVAKVSDLNERGYKVKLIQWDNNEDDVKSVDILNYPYNMSNITKYNELAFGKDPKRLYNEKVKLIYNELKS